MSEQYKCPRCGASEWEERWETYVVAPAGVSVDNNVLTATSHRRSAFTGTRPGGERHIECGQCGYEIVGLEAEPEPANA